MPIWLLGVFSILGKHTPRIIWYGLIILGIGFFLYSAFLKPTNTTTIGSGGKQINVYHSSDIDIIPLIGCSAWRMRADVGWKKPINEQGDIKK